MITDSVTKPELLPSLIRKLRDFQEILFPARHLRESDILMSLRILRTIRPNGLGRISLAYRIYQARKYTNTTTQANDNPTTSAERVLTSQPSSAKEIPLTINSHGPIIQNPKHTKRVTCQFKHRAYISYLLLRLTLFVLF